jgi:ATP-dependent Lhr-like helicase
MTPSVPHQSGPRRSGSGPNRSPIAKAPDPFTPARTWFAQRNWQPFPFQEQVWTAYLAGKSGLLHAPTGMGKTFAVAMGPLLEELALREAGAAKKRERGLKLLWLTPLRALANDTAEALIQAVEGLGLNWSVELRTGDTAQSKKRKQRTDGLPNILVTTPESLSVMLSYPDLVRSHDGEPSPLADIRAVIVDEWHELLGTKRGVQTELTLARARALNPKVRTWGLSATLGNLDEAMSVLLGPKRAPEGVMVKGLGRRRYNFSTVIPPDIERFPWAGHLGIKLLPQVCEAIDSANSTLLFTNTRSQSEIWFSSLLRANDKYLGQIAIHHGSLDRKLRSRVEQAVQAGELKCVVCTSSLDLGVDFAPVDQVIQIGSPKGIARFLQRAGRSGHQPGGVSNIVCVPTHALELVEFAAARDAIAAEEGPVNVEKRDPLTLQMDVLVQHMLTLAVGGGFDDAELLAEVRTTHAFAGITDQQWRWAMDYIQRGGPALTAYAHYARVVRDAQTGKWRMTTPSLVRNHRLGIGTITSDASIAVKLTNGKVLGSVEESFIGKMVVGDVFAFSGRILELVRVREMTASVRPARRKSGNVPSWQGSRMALSTHLANAVRVRLGEAHRGEFRGPEMHAAAPILKIQDSWSTLPQPGELLIEYAKTKEGHHAFVYPLEGRLVHEGLAALSAWRFAKTEPRTFTLACNDYGFHLLSPTPFRFDEARWREALSTERLAEDLLACLNAAQLARRQFRDIARVAGLIIPGFPGQARSNRQLQASSELFYDVFSEFDPENLLLDQARRQVLEKQLEFGRLAGALGRLVGTTLRLKDLAHLSPFAFPLWVDSLREQLSTERWTDRLSRMLVTLEAEAGEPAQPPPRAGRKRTSRK